VPARIDQGRRDAILSDIQAGLLGRNAIARRHDVAPSTVGSIAVDAGMPAAFVRELPEPEPLPGPLAADAKARRAHLEERFLAEAELMLEELHRPYVAYSFGGRDNTYAEHQLPAPPDTARRNLMVSAAVAMDKALAISRHDSSATDGVTEVAVWVRTRMGGGAPPEMRQLITGEVIG